jgi:ABC-type multidrug transport system fused ATPase/permease subunit
VVEVGANFARRFASNVASMRMEFALRNDFYAHLQSLQVSFHDGWQSGQLLSRAVADVESVRRFIGFGLVFAGYFVALWLCVLAILVWLDWKLALLMLLLGLPIYGASHRFFRHYRVIARRVQDQTGDLTRSSRRWPPGCASSRPPGATPSCSTASEPRRTSSGASTWMGSAAEPRRPRSSPCCRS